MIAFDRLSGNGATTDAYSEREACRQPSSWKRIDSRSESPSLRKFARSTGRVTDSTVSLATTQANVRCSVTW